MILVGNYCMILYSWELLYDTSWELLYDTSWELLYDTI